MGRREVKRGTGRRREDAACFSGARVEGERTREGQGWPRTGMGEGTLPPTREEELARLPVQRLPSIFIAEIFIFTAKAGNFQVPTNQLPGLTLIGAIQLSVVVAKSIWKRRTLILRVREQGLELKEKGLSPTTPSLASNRGAHQPHLPDAESKGRHPLKPAEPESISLPLILK